ncbi:tetratricopeptide repeat protein [Chryseosolibacter indicus]|uniref:Tetratricopeptide repeat protein n=1 Tax=Chryseosolibacter indicus TaxID=2782351 RepID=A0ABS5VRK7_9BACT|nr:tetratricopeptide repeat protein [Chryseosolibacter indicus]
MNYRILFAIFLVSFSLQLHAQDQLSQSKAERLYQKGTELIAHANYGAARKVFSDFLETSSFSDPRRSEAEYYVAFSALTLSHIDGEKLIDNFIVAYPSSPKAATAYYDLANFFYNEKSYTKASQYFKKVDFPSLTLDQQNQAHFKWGYSYFNLKKLDEALEQFNFVKTQSSEYAPASNYYAGFIEYSKGNYDQALTDLKKAELNSAYASVVPYLIANVYYRQKRYDDLLAYANAIKSRKDIANANEVSMLIAEAYYFKGEYKNAIEAYEKYLADNPGKAETSLLFRAGFANYSLNQAPKAIEYLSKAAATKDSVSYYASYYLGILYLKQGEKPLALNAFDFARKYPKDNKLAEEATFQYAKLTYDVGRQDQSIAEFEKFLQTYRGSTHTTEIKELLAQAYVNGSNFNKAIEYIEALSSRSASIDQAYQKATFLKGTEAFNKEDYAQAVTFFEKSLKSPKDPAIVAQASYWAGESYSVGRRFDDAIRHYQKVIDLSTAVEPELVTKARYGLGYAHYNLEAYDKALFNFKEFVNRTNKGNPNHADGLIRLADCYYVSKQYPSALDNYNRARNIGSPDNDYILLQSGVIHGIQRNYSESSNQLTTLIKNYPKSQYRDEALFQRAQFDIEQGNSQAAIDGLSTLIRESSNSKFLPYAYMRRAASYFNLKQYDRTISDYKAVITQFPGHPVAQESLLPLQEALTIAGRSGEFEASLAQFKRANPDNQNLEHIEYETAKNLYFDQQYQKALDKLNTFVSAYPQSAKVQEAKYYIAESYYRIKDYGRALPVYVELSRDKTFNMGNRVAGRVAELEFKNGKYENAVSQFHVLERLATNKKEQYNAWVGLMESFYLMANYDSSALYAKRILDNGAVNASAQSKASLYLGKIAFAKGDYEAAKDEFLNTVNAAQDEHGAEAKYMIAQVLYIQKQYKQSYETLISLNNDFATYDNWVGKSYLLLADNFVAMGDTFQAKATLQSLIDNFPLKDIKDEAQKKLREVEKAEQDKKQQGEADTLEINR